MEATFEVRFHPRDAATADLLPGMLFPSMQRYVSRIESGPIAGLPSEIIAKDPSFWYQPSKILRGEHYSLAIGSRVVNFSVHRPYPGWPQFRSAIEQLLSALQPTEQVIKAERFSLKYRNLIATNEKYPPLHPLNVSLDVAGLGISEKSTNIRCETELNGLQNAINILTKARATNHATNETLYGVVIDVDSIYLQPLDNFWNDIPELLENAHDTEKFIFFSLLTAETLRDLNPIWE